MNMKNTNSMNREVIRDFELDAEVEMYTARGRNFMGEDRYILDQKYGGAPSTYMNKLDRTFEELCGLGET